MAYDWREFIRKGTYTGEERVEAKSTFKEAIEISYIPNEVSQILRFVGNKSKIIALDLGCNKGLWAKALLKARGGDVERIFMADACQYNISEVKDRSDNLVFEEEDFSTICPMHLAIGEQSGSVDFYTNEVGAPVASIFPHTVAGEHPYERLGSPRLDADVIKVPMQTIDNIVAIHGIDHIDILKLDIEGNELAALRGAQETFGSKKIDVVEFEFGCSQVQSRTFFADFYAFFKANGFDIYKINGDYFYKTGDFLEPINSYTYELENFGGAWNFIASRKPLPVLQVEGVAEENADQAECLDPTAVNDDQVGHTEAHLAEEIPVEVAL